jgi:F-type H+-transporting ATPase subunit epsilon
VEEQAFSVALRTTMGEIEVLYGHAPIVVLLEPGEMRVLGMTGAARAYAAGEGFARIDRETVTIFSDMAEAVEGIAIDQVEEAIARAEKALAAAVNLSEDERIEAELTLRESQVKIQLSLRHGTGSRRHGAAPR